MTIKKSLVIFSGGQDSTTCLGWAKNRYKKVIALSFLYNQNHKIEIRQAVEICKVLDIEHHIIDINFYGNLVDSALTHGQDINKKHSRLKHLPASFVPNRNALFIILAHSFAQSNNINTIIGGMNAIDYSGYPDCREYFIKAIEWSLYLGSESDIKIITPLMHLNKKEIFQLAKDEGILDIVLKYSLTCYNGDITINDWGMGCGECPACKLRKNGYRRFKRT